MFHYCYDDVFRKLSDFFKAYTRYRALRDFEGVQSGEELTFMRMDIGFDRFVGDDYAVLAFVEKDLQVGDTVADSELRNAPERYFFPLGPAEQESSDQALKARHQRERAEAAQRSRRQMLEAAQRKLEKRKKKALREKDYTKPA